MDRWPCAQPFSFNSEPQFPPQPSKELISMVSKSPPERNSFIFSVTSCVVAHLSITLCFCSLVHGKSHFPSPHKHLYKIPVKIKLDWLPRTSQLIEMTLSPLCLAVWTIISTFHSDSLEKSKSRAKVYIFYVNNDLPTVWFLSRSCLFLMG